MDWQAIRAIIGRIVVGYSEIGAVEHLFMRCPVNFIQQTKA
jgi:hypothetical protein